MVDIASIQQLLVQHNIDAWFLYDFRHSNSIAWNILGLSSSAHCTRRWGVCIPKTGEPIKITSTMEQAGLSHLPFEHYKYNTGNEWFECAEKAMKGFSTIAIEYSPNSTLPTVSKVDAGFVEWMRSIGKTIVSSADITVPFESVLTEEQRAEQRKTAKDLRQTMIETFLYIRENVLTFGSTNEYAIQQYILGLMEAKNLMPDHAPIVAKGVNAASPHYFPNEKTASKLEKGDVLLIDMWAQRNNQPKSVFADITWMCYLADEVPKEYATPFDTLVKARNTAASLVQERFKNKEAVYGFEVDDASRRIVNEAGYGKYFIHRAGHSITHELHGAGVNMDNYEAKDIRKILRGTSFSIEPGIYIDDFCGFRTELDVLITSDGTVYPGIGSEQSSMIPLLHPNIEEITKYSVK